jgi:hypothetical protein
MPAEVQARIRRRGGIARSLNAPMNIGRFVCRAARRTDGREPGDAPTFVSWRRRDGDSLGAHVLATGARTSVRELGPSPATDKSVTWWRGIPTRLSARAVRDADRGVARDRKS